MTTVRRKRSAAPGASRTNHADVEGLLFDIDTFAVHDGPGIRMAVYLKGCVLSCLWCHSPESLRPAPEVIWMRDRCTFCGACVPACPRSVHARADGAGMISSELCVACGRCVESCPAGALALRGFRVKADAIVGRAVRMKPFFAHSGGGVTLTGGEVTMQPDFASALLEGCRREGIHTAAETCGFAMGPVMERIADKCDLLLYDIKLIDDKQHRRWTGVSNTRILDNARRLAGRNVEVRIPLIPAVTDTAENLEGIFAFMREAGLSRAGLLPYNAAAPAKYEWFGRSYTISAEPQKEDRLAAVVDMARRMGVNASVV